LLAEAGIDCVSSYREGAICALTVPEEQDGEVAALYERLQKDLSRRPMCVLPAGQAGWRGAGRFLRTREYAQLAGVAPSTVRAYAAAGLIPGAVRARGGWLLPRY
jgi:hypothetical protein